MTPSCTVSSVQKVLRFHVTIALQQQVDLGVRGWKRNVGAHEVAGLPDQFSNYALRLRPCRRCGPSPRRQPCHQQNGSDYTIFPRRRGNHAGDHFSYPNCRPDFIKGMSAAIRKGTDK